MFFYTLELGNSDNIENFAPNFVPIGDRIKRDEQEKWWDEAHKVI